MEKPLASTPIGGLNVIFGTGPLGLATARALLARGMRVRLVNRSGRRPPHDALFQRDENALVHQGLVEFASCDATKAKEAIAAARGAAHVFHCANPRYDQWAEVLPPLQAAMIESALENAATLIASEPLYMYLPSAGTIDETTPIDPPTKKGRIRQAMHELLKSAEAKRGLRWVTLRASDYYGPGAEGQSAFGTTRFLEPLASGKAVSFLGNPDFMHSYTYLDDYGRSLALGALTPASWGKAWIVPTAPARSTRELANMFAAELERLLGASLPRGGLKRKFGAVPRSILRLAGLFDPVIREVDEMLYQWRSDYVVDGAAFERAFGLAPTSLERGIVETVSSFSRSLDQRR
ncbi:MAG TPA: NAD-dependent epimerase/dehydratase family protein [Rectinemataceae bacterium]|nr:NAD-dependent epimerase/dehydratase family protein [Rectinemataceae bacterium]